MCLWRRPELEAVLCCFELVGPGRRYYSQLRMQTQVEWCSCFGFVHCWRSRVTHRHCELQQRSLLNLWSLRRRTTFLSWRFHIKDLPQLFPNCALMKTRTGSISAAMLQQHVVMVNYAQCGIVLRLGPRDIPNSTYVRSRTTKKQWPTQTQVFRPPPG